MGKLHTKKIQHKYFEDILKKGKKFEIRKNDCDYQVGDFVILAEYDGEKPMNNSVLVEITYVLKDITQYGLDKDYCIFGFVERWLSLEGMEEERSEKLKVIKELQDFALENNTEKIDWKNNKQLKFFINFDCYSNRVGYSYTDDCKTLPLNIYFTSRELALKAIEKVGEERIKKYYFDIDDEDCEKQKEEK